MLKTFYCPACHASLDLPETLSQPTVKCPYCNTTVIVPEDLRHSGQGRAATEETDEVLLALTKLLQEGKKIEAIKQYHEFFKVDLRSAKDGVEALEASGQPVGVTAVYTPVAATSAGCAGGAFVMMTLLILLIGGAGVFLYFFLTPSGGSFSEVVSSVSQLGQNVQLNGPTLLLPAGDGQPADLIFLNRGAAEETMQVGYFDGSAGQRRWQSEALGGKIGSLALFADERAIYYVSESVLAALDRENGRLLWQTALSDRLPYTCQDCILPFGDRLVVQTLDNNLVALNSVTGEQLWQNRLNLTSPRGLYRVGSWAGVMTSDEGRDGGLDLIDPATGQVANRLEPRCPHPNFDPQDPSLTDPILVDDADQSVYFVFGFFTPKCVQRWDYVSGSQVWSTFVEEGLPSTDATMVQDNGRFYYNTNNDQIVAVNKADGTVTPLLQEAGYNLVPLISRNNVLLVQATRTQGSRREELWGLDSVSGGALWKVVPQESEMLEAGSVSVVHTSNSGYWLAQPTLSSVYLVQARHNPPRLVVETLGLRDGASGGQTTLPLTGVTSSYWIDLAGWDQDRVWLKIDLRHLWAVDAGKAEVVQRWP